MKLPTKLTLYMVIMALVAVTIVTLLSIRTQTNILSRHGVAPRNIEDANGTAIRHSVFIAFILVTFTALAAFVLFHRSAVHARRESEIVDELPHSIGNAINSVTIGISTLRENMVNGKLTRRFLSLASAVDEHRDDFGDYVKNDPQGQKVAPFIIALADDLAKHDRELAKTTNRVYERAEHIANIIRKARQRG